MGSPDYAHFLQPTALSSGLAPFAGPYGTSGVSINPVATPAADQSYENRAGSVLLQMDPYHGDRAGDSSPEEGLETDEEGVHAGATEDNRDCPSESAQLVTCLGLDAADIAV